MKKIIIGIVIIVFLAAAGFGVWYFFLKKSAEGGKCHNQSTCETGLNCVNNICSSGKLGSGCINYKDCDSGLLCTKSICSAKPDYTKYFDKVTISKMKPGSPPGSNNPLIQTTNFVASTDAIEIDFIGVKSTTIGDYHIELINSVTGERAFSTQDRMPTKFEGRDTGTGTDLSGVTAGEYDINVIYNNELVYSTTITLQ